MAEKTEEEYDIFQDASQFEINVGGSKTSDGGASSTNTENKKEAAPLPPAAAGVEDNDDAKSTVSGASGVAPSETASSRPRQSSQKEKLAPVGDDWDAVDDGDIDDVLHTWPPDRVRALQDALKTAAWHDTSYKMQTIKNTLTGEEIADWLQSNNFARSVDEVMKVGDAMLTRGMFFQLNRKKKRLGFFLDPGFKYTQKEIKVDEGILARLQGVAGNDAKSTAKATAGAKIGVTYDRSDALVVAFVEQRVRRHTKDDAFCGEDLTSSDPPEFSMAMEEVPIPAVGDAPPDECEWVLDWEVVVTEETDAAGWRYGVDFRGGSTWEKDLTSLHLIRKREWRRPARKRVDKPKEDGRGEVAGEHRTEEEQQKEMLAKAAQVRVPRSGFLELSVSYGRDLLRVCDSIVTVEHRDQHDKSEVSKKADHHNWNFKSNLNIANDMEPVRISVWQVGKLGKKPFLGEVELFIPEFATEGTARTMALRPRQDETEKEVAEMSETLGSLLIEWNFTVDELAQADTQGVKQDTASGGRRVILDLNVDHGEEISVNKRRGGMCGGISFKKKKAKVFLRAYYRGEFSDMISQSPRVLINDGKPNFKWRVSIPLVPTVPLRVECYSEDGNLIGEVKFTEQPGENPAEETTKEFKLERPEVDNMASAETNFGYLIFKWRWLVESDPFAALGEAARAEKIKQRQLAEEEKAREEQEEKEGKKKKKKKKKDGEEGDDAKDGEEDDEDGEEDNKSSADREKDGGKADDNKSTTKKKDTGKDSSAAENGKKEPNSEDVPVFIPKRFLHKDLLEHW